MNPVPKTLGLDFGVRRIGVAVSQSSLVEPLVTLINSPQVMDQILALCGQHGIRQIVVGVSEGISARRTHDFITKLKSVTQLPIFTTDETLSTKEARAKLKEAGRRIKPGEPVDHYAAALILESWLVDL
ncbi:Holliday junction resolvase RuvX [Patescibacteria group bacterium]|nr:Holliday junction resolvase RuvX [Patescibacteria group bacterium]